MGETNEFELKVIIANDGRRGWLTRGLYARFPRACKEFSSSWRAGRKSQGPQNW